MNETQPLLRDTHDSDLERVLSKNGYNNSQIVDFDPNGDPENPVDWPKAYKRGIVALLALMAFTTFVQLKRHCVSILTSPQDLYMYLCRPCGKPHCARPQPRPPYG